MPRIEELLFKNEVRGVGGTTTSPSACLISSIGMSCPNARAISMSLACDDSAVGWRNTVFDSLSFPTWSTERTISGLDRFKNSRLG